MIFIIVRTIYFLVNQLVLIKKVPQKSLAFVYFE